LTIFASQTLSNCSILSREESEIQPCQPRLE
jgi:hypothetical protein